MKILTENKIKILRKKNLFSLKFIWLLNEGNIKKDDAHNRIV